MTLELPDLGVIDERMLKKLLRRLPKDALVEAVANLEEIQEVKAKLGPQTKDELWKHFKDKYDVELSRVAVCEGHTCQLDMVWEVYSFAVSNVLWVVDRGGGKTSLMAWTDDTQCDFYPGFESFCVPLDAQILTRRGWVTYGMLDLDQDETLGFNPKTGKTEWTRITDVSVFRDRETFDVGNHLWRARCTAGHSWSVTKNWYVRGKVKPKSVFDHTKPFEDIKESDRIRLSAVAEGGDLDISPTEAAVLGWVFGDGHSATRHSLGRKRAAFHWGYDDEEDICKTLICQAKPEGVEALRELLNEVPHTESIKTREDVPDHYLQTHRFWLKTKWFRDVAKRTMISKVGLEGFVMGLSIEAREAFMDAIVAAEGWVMEDKRYDGGGTTCFAQNEGEMLDALVLCAYLCGYRPKTHPNDRGTMFKANAANKQVLMCRPYTWGGSFRHEPSGLVEDVWCPTTELGTWTMRWQGQILLTGNTIGPGKSQGQRKYAHILPYVLVGGVIGGKEQEHIARSTLTETQYMNGSKMEIALGGCLPYRGKIITRDGPEMIGKIVDKKMPVEVKSYDFEAGEIVWSKVTGWHANGDMPHAAGWLRIKYDLGPGAPSHATTTLRHQIMRPDGSKTEAQDLAVGDEVCTMGLKFSDEQEQVFTGLLLGDGGLLNTSTLSVSHSSRQAYYLDWFDDALAELNPNRKIRSGDNRDEHISRYKVCRRTRELRQEWYPEGTKRIPDRVWDELDDLGLAIWFMDDGGFVKSGRSQIGCWELAALHFNSHERARATEMFERMGIDGKWVVYDAEKDQRYWKTASTEASMLLTALLEPFIDISVKQEKGWKRWVAAPVKQHSKESLIVARVELIEVLQHVPGKNSKRQKGERYDITVEGTACYMTSCGLLVSNTPEQANGPRVPRLHRDEIELLDDKTRKQAGGIPAGRKSRDGRHIPPQTVDTSTMKWAGGYVDQAMEEYRDSIIARKRPRQEVRISCIFESAAENPACRSAPDAQRRARLIELGRDPNELCECDSYEHGFIPNEDPDAEPEIRTLEYVCQGRFFRSRGYKGFEDVTQAFNDTDPETWEAERECSQPARDGAYLKAYSQLRSGIKGYEPRPEYGDIYTSTDWGGCFDAATDVLTDRGWVSIVDVTTEDRVATLCLADERVQFLNPMSTWAQDHDGLLHRYKNKHIDLLVTPNHKMVVAPMRDYGAPLYTKRSDEVPRSSRMSKTSAGRVDARHEAFVLPAARMGEGGVGKNELKPDLEIAAEDWAAFFGLWMAEGHTYLGKCSGGQDRVTGQVCITHLDEKNMAEMESIMSKYFNIKFYAKNGSPRGTMMIHDVRLYVELSRLGKAFEKRLPEYVKTWSIDLLRIYFDWHLRGDGNRNRIYTSSRALADDLQEIAMYAGYSADITTRSRTTNGVIDGREIKARHPEHTVHLQRVRNRPHIWSRSHQPECKTEVQASEVGVDKVYCVTMPMDCDRVIYVRRNDKPVWCGNTDEHSHGWYQWLQMSVEITMWKSGTRRIILPGSVVRFGEIFKAHIGDMDLGRAVQEQEAEWQLRWPGWMVKERYADMASATARLNWRDQLGLDVLSRVKKDFDAEVKMVRSLVGSRYFYIDIPACPMGDKAIRAWRQVNGHEVHDWSSHPMAELRYFESNRLVHVRKSARANKVEAQGSGPAAAGDEEARAQDRKLEQAGRVKVTYHGRPPQERHEEYEVLGNVGAADSPMAGVGGRVREPFDRWDRSGLG
jgi:hypothetical protein